MQVDLIDALRNSLTAFNIFVLRVTPPYSGMENFDYGLRREIDPMFDWREFGRQLVESQTPKTLTFTEDTFGARYATFSPPGEEDTVILIGPWRGARRTREQEMWAQQCLSPSSATAVRSYYDAIPQVSERPLLGSIIALVRMAFPTDEFRVEKQLEFRPLALAPDSRLFQEPELLQNYPAALLEQRYAAENEVIDAVTKGDSSAALRAYQRFTRFSSGEQSCGTVRSRKNDLIVLNTLLRKAIERVGVHPCYLDSLCTKYSYKIETIANESEVLQMQNEMLQEYCTYVQRYSLRQYSPPVQKTINYIQINLDKPLSLKDLAAQCFISPSYLSNLFKQETGTTLTDYINMQRIKRAAYRLATTNESIAVIAGRVGMLDVNYFTKLFKKQMGMTPTRYRRERRL